MRNMADFSFIARGVSLHPGEKPLTESGRFGIAAEQQLIRTVHVFNSCPDIVAVKKLHHRFQQIAIAHVASRDILIPAPKQQRRPIASRKRTVVLHRRGHAPDVFSGGKLLRALQLRNGILQAPVLAGIGGDPGRPRIHLPGVDVPAELVGLAAMKSRGLQPDATVGDVPAARWDLPTPRPDEDRPPAPSPDLPWARRTPTPAYALKSCSHTKRPA